jgi:hypothetical protein
MPDVFISYSRTDKQIALSLATDLKHGGLDVWWDLELYAGDNFHDVILAALDASRVTIVIWSKTAVRSAWVRDEATRALKRNKLIPTYAPGFQLDTLPLGFGQVQCELVSDRPKIYRALSKFGLEVQFRRSTRKAPPPRLSPKAFGPTVDVTTLYKTKQPRRPEVIIDYGALSPIVAELARDQTRFGPSATLSFLRELAALIGAGTPNEASKRRVQQLSQALAKDFALTEHAAHTLIQIERLAS